MSSYHNLMTKKSQIEPPQTELEIFKAVAGNFLWKSVRPDIATLAAKDEDQERFDDHKNSAVSSLREFISRVLRYTDITIAEIKNTFEEINVEVFHDRQSTREKLELVLHSLESLIIQKSKQKKTVEEIVEVMNQEDAASSS
jgi:hypothetical protein